MPVDSGECCTLNFFSNFVSLLSVRVLNYFVYNERGKIINKGCSNEKLSHTLGVGKLSVTTKHTREAENSKPNI